MSSDIEIVSIDSDVECCKIVNKGERYQEDLRRSQQPAKIERTELLFPLQPGRNLVSSDHRQKAVECLLDVKRRPKWKQNTGIQVVPYVKPYNKSSSIQSSQIWSRKVARKQSSSSPFDRPAKRPCFRNEFSSPSHRKAPSTPFTPASDFQCVPSASCPALADELSNALIEAAMEIDLAERGPLEDDDECIRARLFLFQEPWKGFKQGFTTLSETDKHNGGLLFRMNVVFFLLIRGVRNQRCLHEYQYPFKTLEEMFNKVELLFASFPYRGEKETPISYVQESSELEPMPTPPASHGAIQQWKYLVVELKGFVASTPSSYKWLDQPQSPSSPVLQLQNQQFCIPLHEFMEICFSPLFPPNENLNFSHTANVISSSSSSKLSDYDVQTLKKIVRVQIPEGQKPFEILIKSHGKIWLNQGSKVIPLKGDELRIVNETISVTPRFMRSKIQRQIKRELFTSKVSHIRPDFSTYLTPPLEEEKRNHERKLSRAKIALQKIDNGNNDTRPIEQLLKDIPQLIDDRYALKAWSESVNCRIAPFTPMMDGDAIGYSWDFEEARNKTIKRFMNVLGTFKKEQNLKHVKSDFNITERDVKKLIRFSKLCDERTKEIVSGKTIDPDEVEPVWIFDSICVRKISTDDERKMLRGQLGVFAIRDIQQDEMIGPYVGKLRCEEAKSEIPCMAVELRQRYEMGLGENLYIDSSEHGNRLNFVNDFRTCPEAEYLNDRERINCAIHDICQDSNMKIAIFQATKFILQGTEVLVDYGKDYWSRQMKATTALRANHECRSTLYHISNRRNYPCRINSNDHGTAAPSTSSIRSKLMS